DADPAVAPQDRGARIAVEGLGGLGAVMLQVLVLGIVRVVDAEELGSDDGERPRHVYWAVEAAGKTDPGRDTPDGGRPSKAARDLALHAGPGQTGGLPVHTEAVRTAAIAIHRGEPVPQVLAVDRERSRCG